ncbi:hypothetical protein LTS14_007879 [Recurvomyces mirabilis]|uniref:uncharacterized protein n=1 Tax=Recurvomyces mirabilis TaxID=574656 RepID=UPI002DDE50B8|nr:hypothetical protein LTS14_007879 [Recurvomyces mirabilis]
MATTLTKRQTRLIAIAFPDAALEDAANSTFIVRNGIDRRDHLNDAEFDDRILPRTLERINDNPAKDKSGAGAVVAGGVLRAIFARRDISGSVREQLKSCNTLAFIALIIKDYEAEAEDRNKRFDQAEREGQQRQHLESGVDERGDSEVKALRKEERKKEVREDLEKEERSRMMME